MKYLFLFFLLFLEFTSLSLLVKGETSSLHSGVFFIYNLTTVQIYQNEIHIIKQIEVQRILSVYSNGTILVNLTIYNVNFTNYFAPIITLNNASVPADVFYVSPYLLGKNITRGGTILIYKGQENGFYVYQNISYIQGGEWILTMWLNSYGIVEKAISIQTGDVLVHSNTSYTLWLTNFNNSSVNLPTFNGYTLAKTYSIVDLKTAIIMANKIEDIVVIIGIFGILVILIFRK